MVGVGDEHHVEGPWRQSWIGLPSKHEVDVDALARRDTKYAVHELRRILVLTLLVVVALVVLTIVLR